MQIKWELQSNAKWRSEVRKLKLTQANYYSVKSNETYFSVSQFKDFMKCPAMAIAKLRGEYDEEFGRALLLGSYVDEMLTGTRKSQMDFLE